ncbi:hypothetical protein DICVIV_11725 [Dictyocaulus viviparus]|uniref:Uncharacterized protein n=1 Tax=Dictyocaulus viviparus TaxID=29172 RepID=A0A0D8XIZ3_DICVI|nr:hypothetical protein DICVIV_11725 [Dictyocaulus viviparus]
MKLTDYSFKATLNRYAFTKCIENTVVQIRTTIVYMGIIVYGHDTIVFSAQFGEGCGCEGGRCLGTHTIRLQNFRLLFENYVDSVLVQLLLATLIGFIYSITSTVSSLLSIFGLKCTDCVVLWRREKAFLRDSFKLFLEENFIIIVDSLIQRIAKPFMHLITGMGISLTELRTKNSKMTVRGIFISISINANFIHIYLLLQRIICIFFPMRVKIILRRSVILASFSFFVLLYIGLVMLSISPYAGVAFVREYALNTFLKSYRIP